MAQKYKFFIKDKAVIFRQDAVFKENDQWLVEDWIERLRSMQIEANADVSLSDLTGFIKMLQKKVPFVVAGGGLVFNGKDELLMIHRRGFWDLPKGKQESEEEVPETAVREVEEECGIQGPEVVSAPFSTYHLYRDKGSTCVKHSVWYRMKQQGIPALVPQKEEDIDQAVWVKLPIEKHILDGAYPSIIEVLDHFI